MENLIITSFIIIFVALFAVAILPSARGSISAVRTKSREIVEFSDGLFGIREHEYGRAKFIHVISVVERKYLTCYYKFSDPAHIEQGCKGTLEYINKALKLIEDEELRASKITTCDVVRVLPRQ